MRDSARAVVIGGGVGGCAILYWLARLGWSDVLLVERADLTSGSTFHSAGLVGQLRSSLSLTKMMMESVELYRTLGAEVELEALVRVEARGRDLHLDPAVADARRVHGHAHARVVQALSGDERELLLGRRQSHARHAGLGLVDHAARELVGLREGIEAVEGIDRVAHAAVDRKLQPADVHRLRAGRSDVVERADVHPAGPRDSRVHVPENPRIRIHCKASIVKLL